jgi:hypothetical protein
VKSKDFNALPSAKVRFVEPMYALPFKTKTYRRATNGSTRLDLTDTAASPGGTQVGSFFGRGEKTFSQSSSRKSPEPVNGSANTLVDRESVALDESGRVSFNLLQHHRSKAQALVFYAFDVLIYRGPSVLNIPLYF